MQVILCNRDHPEYGAAAVPLPIPDEEYDHWIETLDHLEIGDVTAHDCYVDQITDAPPALDMLEGTLVNVDELDFLARSLDRYTTEELAKFQALTATREQWDMQTLINLSFSCEQATVITDFSDLEAVGRSHYITIHGASVPTEEYRQLNGVGIARSLIAEGEGKVTPYGVLYENGMHLEHLYDGLSFPPYEDQRYLLELEYETPREGSVTFFLPQPEKRLDRLLERSKIMRETDLDLVTWFSDLPDAVSDRLNVHSASIFDLNRLCTSLQKLEDTQMQKLAAVIRYTEPESAPEIKRLAENLDQFDFIPGIKTAEDYGKHMIRDSGRFDFDENLADFYDYAAYGQQLLDTECGEFNELGYVSYHGTQSLENLMAEAPAQRTLQMGGMA